MKKTIEKRLSPRELDVLKLMADGLSRSQISEQLEISVLTYDEHRKKIRNKLNLSSPADWAKAMIPFM